jgi:plastocyanin
MNRISAALGIVLIFISALLFLITFSGGSLGPFVITGTNPTSNFLAFTFVIIFLPVGAGLAFFGLAYHRPILAAGARAPTYAGSGLAKAALALAIIAIILALGAFVTFFTVPTGASSSSVSNLKAQISGIANVNATPTTRLVRVDWCNTDNTGQDRFCPSQITVNQGDIVVILFEHNDTDAHTFTMLPLGTVGYDLQINATFGKAGYTTINGTSFSNGMHNFLTNTNFTNPCTNVPASSLAQQQASVSTSLCVSGSSLMAQISDVAVVNPTPGLPLNASAPGGGLVELNDSNSVFFLTAGGNMSEAYAVAAGFTQFTNPETGVPISGETWGIAAFQATTPGIFEFLCHYHVSNGMFGYLIVLPNSKCNASPTSCGLP